MGDGSAGDVVHSMKIGGSDRGDERKGGWGAGKEGDCHDVVIGGVNHLGSRWGILRERNELDF